MVLPPEEGHHPPAGWHLSAACITFDATRLAGGRGSPALRRRNLHATFFITQASLTACPLWHDSIWRRACRSPGPFCWTWVHSVSRRRSRWPPRKTASARCSMPGVKTKYFHAAPARTDLAAAEASRGRPLMPVMSEAQLRDPYSQAFALAPTPRCTPSRTTATPNEREIGGSRAPAGHRGRCGRRLCLPQRPALYADFSRLHVDAVKRAGYRYALPPAGRGDASTSPYQIPRFTPGPNAIGT